MTLEEIKEAVEVIKAYRQMLTDSVSNQIDDDIKAFDVAVEAMERESWEDEYIKYIKVPKKALKYRTAGMVAYNAEWLKNHFDIERAVICGAQQPCCDCISRQEVLDMMQMRMGSKELYKAVYDLPPVTPQPKTGHWIYENYNWRCSECNETPKTMGYVGTADFMTEHFKFCNHCGAKMVEKQGDKE